MAAFGTGTPMTSRRFLQLDVFTDRAGYGNALAVVLDADGLDEAAMQRFAAWTNLAETTFLLTATESTADYRVRIFTPRQELPFAGHPSVGTAYAALHAGLVQARNNRLVQQCAAGLLPLRVDAGHGSPRIHVQAPAARLRAADSDELSALTGLFAEASADLIARSCVVDNGPTWWIVPLSDESAVRRLDPQLNAMGEICRRTGCVGLAIYAHADDAAVGNQLVVRAFCPNDAVPEDPVTGSANAAIAAVLRDQGDLQRSGHCYRASQGREIGRDGYVDVEVDDKGNIWIGGDCVVAIRGEVDWP